ncbi:hypothetical protein ThvES_00019070 [Thiovulum sp. ES]|nr:hypothetical protein ThvES_00019070 [Thiovulum sp. ES]
MKATELDKKFDDDKDVLDEFDSSTLKKVNHQQKRVNIDFPIWIIEALDKEANRIGVTRGAIIKMWLAEKLENRKILATN